MEWEDVLDDLKPNEQLELDYNFSSFTRIYVVTVSIHKSAGIMGIVGNRESLLTYKLDL